ncbi:MAG: crossover junction endodeoxyribonuclease RuvC [Parcubacteria group bacterium]
MRILGIDPGTSLIGYGIVDILGNKYESVDYGTFHTETNIHNKDRVKDVYDFFKKLIKKHDPEKIALESIFFFKNSKTVTKVSEIRGVLMLVAADAGIELQEFTPLQIKQSISNYGRADKEQVGKMVQLILDLKEVPKPDDVTDALALAIVCGNTTLY